MSEETGRVPDIETGHIIPAIPRNPPQFPQATGNFTPAFPNRQTRSISFQTIFTGSSIAKKTTLKATYVTTESLMRNFKLSCQNSE